MKKILVLAVFSLLTTNAFAKVLSKENSYKLIDALKAAKIERYQAIEMAEYKITEVNCKKNLCNFVNMNTAALVELKGGAANRFISNLQELELTELNKDSREAGMDLRLEVIQCKVGYARGPFANCNVR